MTNQTTFQPKMSRIEDRVVLIGSPRNITGHIIFGVQAAAGVNYSFLESPTAIGSRLYDLWFSA